MATIQDIQGAQFTPITDGYSTYSYQYATSSLATQHAMNPGLVVRPKNVEDIKKTILYAKENKKAIAIRTGGHQYSGASSTGPNNIQLDLSAAQRSGRHQNAYANAAHSSRTYTPTTVAHS